MPPKRKSAARAGSAAPAPDSKAGAPAAAVGAPAAAPARAVRAEPASPALAPRPSLSLLGYLFAFFAALSALTLSLHYSLPTPQAEAPGRFAEANAMETMRVLAHDFGYRIVGTKEHVDAEEWLEKKLRAYEGTHTTQWGDVQVEVWSQIGDGAHRFDFMSASVFKRYYSMSNLIVRISPVNDPAAKENALLVNSHLDSTLPSPGAADDGLGVGIMLELLRLYTSQASPTVGPLRHALVLLFNNGEESLQDASHLYITQHEPTRGSIRGVVNLEACGVSGPELLFQASSEELLRGYAQARRPFGTVLANDVFGSGIILSDTDARIFEEYGHVEMLDMAVVGSSYLYHTRRDIPAHIQPGVAQHFGDNVLDIVSYLIASPESNLGETKPFPRRTPPIYFSVFGRFFVHFTNKSWKALSMGLSVYANFLMSSIVRADRHFNALGTSTAAMLGMLLSLAMSLVSANAVALLMTRGLNSGMSWYSHEALPIALYAPPAIAGSLAVQLVLRACFRDANAKAYLERATLTAMFSIYTLGLMILNAFGIGSAYLLGLGSVTSLLAATANDFVLQSFGLIELKHYPANRRVEPATYFLLAIVPAIFGSEGTVAFLDLFVPLTGRTGEISPSDHIIATIVAALSFMALPMLLPLSHRYGTAFLVRVIVGLMAISALMVAIFASPAMTPFSPLAPKRLFAHQVENITDGAWTMHMGHADAAPNFAALVEDVRAHIAPDHAVAELEVMDENNSAYDILYPVSAFITPYKFDIDTPAVPSLWAPGGAKSSRFFITAKDETLDLEAGTRRVTIEVTKPGLIWSVMAFDADILEWDLPNVLPPTGGRQRHHVKEVGRAGVDSWSLTMLLRLSPDEIAAARARGQDRRPYKHLVTSAKGAPPAQPRDPSRLWIDFSALDAQGMWPSSRHLASSRASLGTFEKMDAYLLDAHPEVDSMLLSVVAGVAEA